jgi:hypothetical protein
LIGRLGTDVAVVVRRNGSLESFTINRDILMTTSLDADCDHALESKPVLIGTASDLDGDNRAEPITLRSLDAVAQRPSWTPKHFEYHVAIARAGRGELRVGTASWPLMLPARHRIAFSVIDIDAADPRNEILLSLLSQDGSDMELHLLTYDGVRLIETPLERGTDAFAIGDGTLTVVQDVATTSNEVRIRYRLQRLSVVEESRITQPRQSD